MSRERKLTPQERYDKANTRRIQLKLNLRLDADVISWLEDKPSMQGAIKELIREQIKREEGSN